MVNRMKSYAHVLSDLWDHTKNIKSVGVLPSPNYVSAENWMWSLASQGDKVAEQWRSEIMFQKEWTYDPVWKCKRAHSI